MEVARREPVLARASWRRIRGIGASGRAAAAQDLLEAVAARAASARPTRAPRARAARRAKPDDAPLVALGEALLRARAREAGLAYELLAARADLQAIVAAGARGRGAADVRTLRGWRRELVGAELLALLDGERLAVGRRRRRAAGACG